MTGKGDPAKLLSNQTQTRRTEILQIYVVADDMQSVTADILGN